MQPLDDMSIDEVSALYNEMREAMKTGNAEKLSQLKNKCPEIFDIKKYAEISALFSYVEAIQTSEWYKESCKKVLEEQLALASFH